MRWIVMIVYLVLLTGLDLYLVYGDRPWAGRPAALTAAATLQAGRQLQASDFQPLPAGRYLTTTVQKGQAIPADAIVPAPPILPARAGDVLVGLPSDSHAVAAGGLNAGTRVDLCQGAKTLLAKPVEVRVVSCGSDGACTVMVDVPADGLAALAALKSGPASLKPPAAAPAPACG